MREKSVSLTVRLPLEISQEIEKLARKRHKTVSDIVRVILERQLSTNEYEKQVDHIQAVIRDEVNSAVKSQANRMAAMLNKITILVASGYFTAAGAVAMLDEDLYYSFDKIETAARKLGLMYSKFNENDKFFRFEVNDLMGEAISKARKNLKKKQEITNFDLTSFDYE